MLVCLKREMYREINGDSSHNTLNFKGEIKLKRGLIVGVGLNKELRGISGIYKNMEYIYREHGIYIYRELIEKPYRNVFEFPHRQFELKLLTLVSPKNLSL